AGSSVTLQPILVDAPDIDEINDLRPVRELLPERTPGAPAVVRVENHPYAGVVPSRARQLVRSMAMCGDDDTRLRPPPPSSMLKTYASVAAIGLPGVAPRHRNSSSLSRESSSYTDYPTDLTEPELRAFIAATLHKNPRDRAVILHLEQTFIDLLNNFEQQSLKLPPVSSYTRMLIHRVAVLFGLDHNVDNSGKRVVVSKTSKSKPPSFLFASLIQSNVYTDNQKYDGSWNYGDVRLVVILEV
ncbi:r3H domain protein, partial [Ostertagia ostertagi]